MRTDRVRAAQLRYEKKKPARIGASPKRGGFVLCV